MTKRRKIKLNIPLSVTIAVILSIGILILLNDYLHIPFLPTISSLTSSQSTAGNMDSDEATGVKTQIEGDCEVHFVDVGQGDCIFISSDGKNILIDGGDVDQDKTVVDYLKKLNVKKIDMVVATHAHADHIGGLDSVIKEFDIGMVLMSKLSTDMVPTTKTYKNLLTAISEKGLKITNSVVGTEYTFGKGKFTVLGPSKQYDDLNNTSVVLKFDYDSKMSFLFTGDMEAEAEKDLLGSKASIDADVLKLGHHGSSTATSKKFYEKVTPRYCVIQVGEGNKYNHPHREVLDLLKKENCEKVYRNDFNGTIVFCIKDGKTNVTLQKQG